MALLPADPRKRKTNLALIAIVVVGAFVAFKMYVLDVRTEDIAAKEQRLESLEAQNRRSKVLAAQRDDLRKRMAVYEAQLRIFEEFIPQSEEVPELLDAISNQAQLTEVELARMRPQQEEPGEFYTKRTWELSVLGDYHDVGRYLARIASLPRVIKPTRVQMGPAPRNRATEDMQAPLEVSFRIETFVLGPASDSLPPPAAGAASSG